MEDNRPLKLLYQVPVLSQNEQAIMRGVANYVRLNANWRLWITNDNLAKVIPMLKDRGVHGAFVHPASKADEVLAENCGIPCILTCTNSPQKVLPYFTANNNLMGKMGAEHFIEKGFANFAYSSLSTSFWCRERFDAFANLIKKIGADVHLFQPAAAAGATKEDYHADPQPCSWLRAADDLIRWLRSLPKPIGILATDDAMAYDLVEAATVAGIRVPDEVAILGNSNDQTRCLLSNPPISSIVLNPEQNGYNAAALMHRIITKKEEMAGQRLLNQPTHIITRQSTDILAVNDPDLATATQFIRTNFSRPIRVPDVVRATATSRRGLEIKFKNHIKHSIADEIMQVKIDHAARLLLESDISVEQISRCLGFCSSVTFRKAFSKIKGINPPAYRRKPYES